MTTSEPTPQTTPTRDEAVRPCPFCGGPAKTFQWNGTLQASCAGDFTDCAGFDVTAPVAMWNRRASAPAPASGRVDAVAVHIADVIESIRPSTFMHQREHGDLYGYCERTRQALYEALSPAATPVSEAEPVAWRYRSNDKAIWNYCESSYPRGVGAEIVEPLYATLAKPASSPAGGDVLTDEIMMMLRYLRAADEHMVASGVRYTGTPLSNVLGVIRDAIAIFERLSQSTSAGRVGE